MGLKRIDELPQGCGEYRTNKWAYTQASGERSWRGRVNAEQTDHSALRQGCGIEGGLMPRPRE